MRYDAGMDQQWAMDIWSGRRRGAGAAALRAALGAAGVGYGGVMRLRRWAYRRGVLGSRQASVPVISVGNITAGGTGKTPMVAWVVGQLAAMGRRPGILTRGYKAVDGRSDEAQLLERLCQTPVVVNPDRRAGADQAVAQGCDVLVMDDGFQHRRLRRDLDIVLIDATNPFGFGRCLPGGLLREPLRALREAHVLLITRADRCESAGLADLEDRLRRLSPGALLGRATHRPVAVIDETGRRLGLDVLAGRKLAAFCGIGNPQQFFDTLVGLNARVACRKAFDDHAAYDAQTLNRLCRRPCMCEAEVFITTQKDYVKLPPEALDRPVWQLAVEMDVTAGQAELTARIAQACGTAAPG